MKDWATWYREKNQLERADYAKRAGVGKGYIEVHLLNRHRCPSLRVVRGLSEASLGRFSVDDLSKFFLRLDSEAA